MGGKGEGARRNPAKGDWLEEVPHICQLILATVMAEQATTWFKTRVTPSEKATIERLAEQKGSTQKEATLRAVRD